MGNTHKHKNSKDSEATLGIYDILNKGRTEEEWNTHGRQTLGGQL